MAIKKTLERSVEMTGIKEESKPFERFSFDLNREREWDEIFNLITKFVEKRKLNLTELRELIPNTNRLYAILRNLSESSEAFVILRKKRGSWFFIGKLRDD